MQKFMDSDRELKNIVRKYLDTAEGRSMQKKFDLAQAPKLLKLLEDSKHSSRIFEILCDIICCDLRKKDGIFFTPDTVSCRMAEEALEIWCKYNKGYSKLKAVKVLDPSCGNGEFLLAMVKVLTDKHLQYKPNLDRKKVIKYIVSNNIYGIDCNKNALNILLKTLEKISGQNVEKEHFINNDTLNFQSAEGFFPEIKKFDIVIGNPPYVSYGLRNCGKLDSKRAAELRTRFVDSAEYKLSLYTLFMEFALRSTADDGIHSFIVPDSFLCGQYYSKIRKFLLENSCFEKFLLLKEKIFRANPGRLVIYFLRKNTPSEKWKFQCAKVDKMPEKLSDLDFYAMKQSELAKNFRQRFRLFFDKNIHKLVKDMELHRRCKLGDILTLASGLVIKNGKKSVISLSGQNGKNCHKCISSSSSVLPGKAVVWQGEYIDLDPEKIKSGLGKVDHREKKLLIRQTGDRIISGVDENGLWVFNNLHVGVSKSYPVDLEALSDYLNSEAMLLYYQAVTLESGRAMAQLDLEILRELPLKSDFRQKKRK